MQRRFSRDSDPSSLCGAIAIFFLALVWWRLAIPHEIYFDEVHYVNAARKQLEHIRVNPEHPMFAKTVLAFMIEWLGDRSLVWRIPSAIGGALGLFAFSRIVWFASGSARAAIIGTVLLATNFFWFIHSRIAMLDMTMASLTMVAGWQLAAAIRLPHQGRWRLALAGVLMGLALGSKWSVAPILALPGLTFLVLKVRDNSGRFLWARSGGPVPGISLPEAGLWLGLVPLAVYWVTYWPAFHWVGRPVNPWDPIAWHKHMLMLQDSVRKPHPYRSVWYQWVGNWRAIWYLYKEVDGAQRGVVLIGNPFTMYAGLVALLWAMVEGVRRWRVDLLAFATLYVISLMFWAFSGKPIQFLYHYLLPSTFLMAILALALDDAGKRDDRWRLLMPIGIGFSVLMFVVFYQIISALPLCCGRRSFEFWMWLPRWS